MSLVGYAASSDEDDSDEETQNNIAVKEVNDATDQKDNDSVEDPASKHDDEAGEVLNDIDDDDDAWELSNDIVNNDNSVSNIEINTIAISSLLPAPKKKQSFVIEEFNDEFLSSSSKTVPLDSEKQSDKPIKTSDSHLSTNESVKDSAVEKQESSSLLRFKVEKQYSGGKKNPVKISLPSLDELGPDSDEEDEEKTKPQPSKRGSSLFSILPKPKHSVVVCANKNKPFTKQANRLLVPHTLSKKEPNKASAQKNSKSVPDKSLTVKDSSSISAGLGLLESDDLSDEDEGTESVNFFSLNEKTDVHTDVIAQQPVLDSNSSVIENEVKDIITASEKTVTQINANCVKEKSKEIKTLPVRTSKMSPSNNKVNFGASKTNDFFKALVSGSDKTKDSNSTVVHVKNDTQSNSKQVTLKVTENASSKCSNSNIKAQSQRQYSDVTGPYGGGNLSRPHSDISSQSSEVTAPYTDVTAPYSDVTGPYGGNDSVTGAYPGDNVTGPYQVSTNYGSAHTGVPSGSNFGGTHTYGQYNASTADIDPFPNNSNNYEVAADETQSLSNDALRQLQGGKRKKEVINFIDLHQDDISLNNTERMKNLTEQSVHAPKKPKHDMPSSKEKRKHQITYLAFQAKEREFELQQAWSENRATKKQTQSRYGF